MKEIFFIPARGGSKSIRHKNLCKIGAKSLASIAIEFCYNCNKDIQIVLSSDCPIILNQSRDLDIIRERRPSPLGSDTTTTVEVILDYVRRNSDSINSESIIYVVEPTSPFRTKKTFYDVRDAMLSGADVCLTGYFDNKVMWSCEDVAQQLNIISGTSSRRQDRSSYIVEANCFFAATVGHLKRHLSFRAVNQKIVLVTKLEAMDINEPIDLKICQNLADIGLEIQ